MYFETQTSYHKRNEKGKEKLVREKFLVDNCVLFAQAEQTTLMHYKSAGIPISEGCIDAIAKSLIVGFINQKTEDEQLIYIATLSEMIEENGKMKKIMYSLGLYAKTMKEAHKCIEDYMAESYAVLTCERVKKSDIIEVLTYN